MANENAQGKPAGRSPSQVQRPASGNAGPGVPQPSEQSVPSNVRGSGNGSNVRGPGNGTVSGGP